MLEERLSLVGGGPRWLNINAAMKVGGFKEPAEIYEGIKNGEIDVNKKMCNIKDPADEHSWVRIEPTSFIQWLEKKSQISVAKVRKSYDNIRQEGINVQVKLGYIQHEIGCLKVEIIRQQQLIGNLIESMNIRNLKNRRQNV